MSSQLAGCAASREQSGDVHTTRHARCSWRQSPLAGQGASHEKSDHIPFVTLDGFMAGPQGETDGMDPLSGFREKDKSSVKQKGNTMYTIIPLSDFQINATAYRFEGGIYGDVAVSFFLVHTAPGQGASLHWHPYAEVFLVQEGKAAFVVGSETVTVDSGNVVIVPAQTPHKYTNVGTTPLRMRGIHPTKEIIQYQLEE